MIDLNKRLKEADLIEFANFLKEVSKTIGFKISSRGWAYTLEQKRFINKDSFDKVTNLINKCRKNGLLPIDFVAEEDARAFKGVEKPTEEDVIIDSAGWLRGFLNSADHYTPNWWSGEKYYIQMLVEKVDLVTLFAPVCKDFHIPIANSKGWSSMLQRAEYARRFQEATKMGLKCVLLYCGDFDPDGLRISEFIRKNLSDLQHVKWGGGEEGYNPENLIIDRFGLSYDFIIENDLTWIDNLITGKGNILAKEVNGKIEPGVITEGKNAGKAHQNFKMPYLQKYLTDYGVRKCEANAIVTMPEEARQLVTDAIVNYLDVNARYRFKKKREAVVDKFDNFLHETGLNDSIDRALNIINDF